MNTNTVEQAIRLKGLMVEQYEFYSLVWIDYNGRKQVAEWQQTVNCAGLEQHDLRLINSDETINYSGDLLLALTLDELHRVFEGLYDLDDELELPALDSMHNEIEKFWFLNPFGRVFPRTKNHAEDWTKILIWLLENGHVTAEQINKILK
jgi:hypothetical protein